MRVLALKGFTLGGGLIAAAGVEVDVADDLAVDLIARRRAVPASEGAPIIKQVADIPRPPKPVAALMRAPRKKRGKHHAE